MVTPAIPQIEPVEFNAGDTVHWQIEIDDYPPGDGWTLKYIAVLATVQKVITATVSGSLYDVLLQSVDTAAFAVGRWHWQSYVTKGSGASEERHTIKEGDWDIDPNFTTLTTGFDARTHAKKVLDALEAMIEGKASTDQMEYTIHGRSLKRLAPAELILWRNFYKQEYLREVNIDRINQGLGSKNRIVTRFTK